MHAEGDLPPGTVEVELTQEEAEAVGRLEALGFDRSLCIEVRRCPGCKGAGCGAAGCGGAGCGDAGCGGADCGCGLLLRPAHGRGCGGQRGELRLVGGCVGVEPAGPLGWSRREEPLGACQQGGGAAAGLRGVFCLSGSLSTWPPVSLS